MKYGSRLREIIKAHPINQAEVIDKLKKFPAAFASYTLEGKAGVLRAMVSRVVIGEGTARIEWKKPFSWIIQTVPYEKVLTGTLKHAEVYELELFAQTFYCGGRHDSGIIILLSDHCF